MLCLMHRVTAMLCNDGTDAYTRYYARYDIMQAPSFSVASNNVCHAYPTKPGPGGLYTNPPGGPTLTYVGRA